MEKADLLKKFGVDVRFNNLTSKEENNKLNSIFKCEEEVYNNKNFYFQSEEEFFKLKIKGNVSELDIIQNLEGNKINKNKLIQRPRNRTEDGKIKQRGKKRKLFHENNIPFGVINSEMKEKSFAEDSSNNSIEHIENVTKNKKSESNLNIRNIAEWNNETFEKIIKEFLNINNFPNEPKEKLNLMKKFLSIYKKIKYDKMKLDNFLQRISDKLNEPIKEVEVILNFYSSYRIYLNSSTVDIKRKAHSQIYLNL